LDKSEVIIMFSESSSENVVQYHSDTTKHYQETLDNLQKMNVTISYVLQAIHNMESAVQEKLNWISKILGCTG